MERRSPTPGAGTVLIACGLVVAALALAGIAGASLVASTQARLVQDRWAKELGSRQQVLERFPTREANPTARELERLSVALGIDLVPRLVPDRDRPGTDDKRGFKRVRGELFDYLNREVAKTRRAVSAPPAGPASYLVRHAAALEAVRDALAGGEAPRWEMRLEPYGFEPVPNLLGHIDLHKLLLADGLAATAGGDDERARADLEASWQLNRSLRDSPVLISQLVAMAIARLQAGALRQVDVEPRVWRERMAEHDYRASLLTALELTAWGWTQIDGEQIEPAPAWRQPLGAVTRPYVRFCLAGASDTMRQRLADMARTRTLCEQDLQDHRANLTLPVPRWNMLGDALVSNLGETIDRLARLQIDLDLTARLLALEADPNSRPRPEPSAACPQDVWLPEAGPDGSLTLTLSRELEPLPTGTNLPTRFTIERRP